VLSIHRALEHRTRALVALLVLAIAALGLGACGDSGGGGGGGDTADVQSLLDATFTGTHRIDSGNVNLQLQIDAQGSSSLRGPIKLALEGPFQSGEGDALPSFDLAVDASAQGQGFKAGLTSTSDRLFVNFGGTAYEVPAELVRRLQQSYRQSRSQSKQKMSLEGLGLHPGTWLKDPAVVGSDSIGGVEAEHVSAQLDVPALLDDLEGALGKLRQLSGGTAGAQVPDRIPADVRRQIEDAVKSAKVDLWTGKDDKTLRKLALDLSIEPSSDSGGPKSVHVALSVELTDLNEPQTIEAPSSSRPLSELLGQLQGLLGGALGGSSGLGGGLGSSGSGSNGSSEQVDKYAQCLQEAGGDAGKMQACASLLSR